jgi:hypothetical protein
VAWNRLKSRRAFRQDRAGRAVFLKALSDSPAEGRLFKAIRSFGRIWPEEGRHESAAESGLLEGSPHSFRKAGRRKTLPQAAAVGRSPVLQHACAAVSSPAFVS